MVFYQVRDLEDDNNMVPTVFFFIDRPLQLSKNRKICHKTWCPSSVKFWGTVSASTGNNFILLLLTTLNQHCISYYNAHSPLTKPHAFPKVVHITKVTKDNRFLIFYNYFSLSVPPIISQCLNIFPLRKIHCSYSPFEI